MENTAVKTEVVVETADLNLSGCRPVEYKLKIQTVIPENMEQLLNEIEKAE